MVREFPGRVHQYHDYNLEWPKYTLPYGLIIQCTMKKLQWPTGWRVTDDNYAAHVESVREGGRIINSC